MSSTREDPEETQAKAEERKKKEHQDAIDRLAKAIANANATKVLLPTSIYTFIRIDNAAVIADLKKEREDALGSKAISVSPSIVTNIDDKDGTFEVYKDGVQIPNVLMYVKGGVISTSVSSENFTQDIADAMIAKALEMGKDLILNVGNKDVDFSKMPIALLQIELRVLDMMIKASNDVGQPYVLGSQARSLLRAVDMANSNKNAIFENTPTTATEDKYLKAEVIAAGNSTSRSLVAATTRDGNLADNKKKIAAQVEARASELKPISDIAALGSPEEKFAAIAKRLEILSKSADVSEAAAKEIKGSVEGADKLLDSFLAPEVPGSEKQKGAELFHNMAVPLDKTSQEDRIQKAEAVLGNLKDRFDPASSATSTRASLQGVVEGENKTLKFEADACKKAVVELEKAEVVKLGGSGKTAADLDPKMQKQIAKLQQQAGALERRVDGMDKANADVNTKVLGTIPGKLIKAEAVLDADKAQFKDDHGELPNKRSPSPRKP